MIAAQGDKSEGLRKVMAHFNSLGVTGAHDMWTNSGDIYTDMLKTFQACSPLFSSLVSTI